MGWQGPTESTIQGPEVYRTLVRLRRSAGARLLWEVTTPTTMTQKVGCLSCQWRSACDELVQLLAFSSTSFLPMQYYESGEWAMAQQATKCC